MSVEIIEHKSRAEAVEAFKRIRLDEDVVGVEFLKAGKVLRVTRSGDAPDEESLDADGLTSDGFEPDAPEVTGDHDAPAEVPGEFVEPGTAGAGTAVNAETGVETAPGEPLPVIEQTDGQPLTTEVATTDPDSSSE